MKSKLFEPCDYSGLHDKKKTVGRQLAAAKEVKHQMVTITVNITVYVQFSETYGQLSNKITN